MTAIERIAQLVRDLQTVGTLRQEDKILYEDLGGADGCEIVKISITLNKSTSKIMETIVRSMEKVVVIMKKEDKNIWSSHHADDESGIFELEISFPQKK